MSKKHNPHSPKRPATPEPNGSGVATASAAVGWVRRKLTAELLSDAHLGSGSGGGGIDALVARDRHDRPVIWASHVEGVLRDAARRLRGEEEAKAFFGRAGGDYARGDRQRAVFTSLYAQDEPECRIWRSTARETIDSIAGEVFYNRAPKDDTLRVIEYVPKGTKLVGEVELSASELPVLQRLVQEVDGLGSGRSTGAGRVKLSLSEAATPPREIGTPTGRLLLLLKNRDPICITATATPDNLIPSLAFVPGRTLLGALAAWLIAEGNRDTASLLTSGTVSVSDALPLPCAPSKLDDVEVLPAPLSLQSEKPKGAAGDVPWWAQPRAPTPRLDAWRTEEKLKRPTDDLFVYRASTGAAWTSFRPLRRVRLRNGRPGPRQPDTSLFAIEQIVEETHFLAELQGIPEDLRKLAGQLGPILEGRRWLRVGRAGAPVEVARIEWGGAAPVPKTPDRALLTLTSDLLVRDDWLRWRTKLDQASLCEVIGTEDISIEMTARGSLKEQQDSVMIHGFNGTSRLWRMPAAAIRRGSVFEISGAGLAKLAERAAKGQWLGERTYEGCGRFRIDADLPGVTDSALPDNDLPGSPDVKEEAVEEAVAAKTHEWFNAHTSLAEFGLTDHQNHKPPSLSQWFDFVADLERDEENAFVDRSAKSWEHEDAKAVRQKLQALKQQRALHARFFVRWLRAALPKETR
jgi:hypothetical protein